MQRNATMDAGEHDRAVSLMRHTWTSIGRESTALSAVRFTGAGDLPSAYAVSDLASATVATAALAVAELIQCAGVTLPAVTVDRRLASFWFHASIRPVGWKMPPIWDPIAGDYRTSDGWIRLHTNAPHHRAAAERVLGRHADRAAMAEAVARWRKQELETAVVDVGGCAAEMRSAAEWRDHPQGRAVATEPLVRRTVRDRASGRATTTISVERPLAGVRVLDLTRVLAGPIATRFLAAFGAEVLRIDPPDWNEPSIAPEVTLGKRCARLNLKDATDRKTFETLLAGADILVHGYRSDALDRLGYGDAARRALAPGLVDVAHCAYGWTGPWAKRRGFDSLVQMSTGIADTGMPWKGADHPVPLPVQAIDHATGYLAAAAAVRGLTQRLREGVGTDARLSLARTAILLPERDREPGALAPESEADLLPAVEETPWGQARRLRPPAHIDGAPMHWSRPASDLGSAEPRWS
jgi:crotonobetainyl-CoA:carnitine CoA-transferase CaiB-like acyl-CoA transferase